MPYQETSNNPHIDTRRFQLYLPGEVVVSEPVRLFGQHIMKTPNLAHRLSVYMNNNTPSTIDWIHLERPLSSYFSLNPFSEDDSAKQLIIEMGMIDKGGSAKLHDYLNKSLDYFSRIKSGYHLVSGHYAKTNYGAVALIDQLSDGIINNKHQAILVATLYANKILPVGGDGQPVFL